MYRNPDCTGNSLTGRVSCAPRDDALWAWNDFSALVTSRWQGGKAGRFTHFIVWNEVKMLEHQGACFVGCHCKRAALMHSVPCPMQESACLRCNSPTCLSKALFEGPTAALALAQVDSSTWFDMSPEVNDTQQHIENTPAADVYVGRYVDMMRLTHDAIARNLAGQPSMMYVSTDRMWTATPWSPGPRWGSRCPLGTSNLLQGIWKMWVPWLAIACYVPMRTPELLAHDLLVSAGTAVACML